MEIAEICIGVGFEDIIFAKKKIKSSVEIQASVKAFEEETQTEKCRFIFSNQSSQTDYCFTTKDTSCQTGLDDFLVCETAQEISEVKYMQLLTKSVSASLEEVMLESKSPREIFFYYVINTV